MCFEKYHVTTTFSPLRLILFPLVLLICFTLIIPLNGQLVQHSIDNNLGGAAEIKVVDIDGDGDLDVVGCGFRENAVKWYEYDRGNWEEHLVKGNFYEVYSIDVADMDYDNDIDIIAASIDDDIVAWFENPGWIQHIIDDKINGPGNVEVVDIDGDDTLDVVVSAVWGNKMIWYEGPSWTQHIIDSDPSGRGDGGAEEFHVFDADNDGDLDIVATIWYAPESWSNAEIVMYEAPDWTKTTVDKSSGYVLGFAAVDIDGDDTTDVVASSFNTDRIFWYKLPGWERHTIGASIYGPIGVTVADVNDDSHPDVVACGQKNANPLRLYLGPDWKMKPIETGTDINFRNAVIVDINNDDLLDVVTSIMNLGQIVWYENLSLLNLDFEELNPDIPVQYTLKQNYPNPFNPSTTIAFTIPKTTYVSLKVFNALGQDVANLVENQLHPGNYTYNWDASDFASGVYYYTIKTESFIETKKLVLIK